MADEKPKIGDINVSLGDGNVVGHIGHTLNLNPSVQRRIGEKLSAGLLQNVPADNMVVVWATHGDQEADRFANEIFSFMKKNGYTMFGDRPTANLYLKPFDGVVIEPGTGKTEIHVGHREKQ